MSALYNMEHNVDSTGAQVVVAKTANSKMPELRLRDQIRGDLEIEPRKSILKRDTNSLDDPNSKVRAAASTFFVLNSFLSSSYFILLIYSKIRLFPAHLYFINTDLTRQVLIAAEVKVLRRGRRSMRKLKGEYLNKSRYVDLKYQIFRTKINCKQKPILIIIGVRRHIFID